MFALGFGQFSIRLARRLITRRRRHFDPRRINTWKPTQVGCDRKSARNPTITQAARDRETTESLGQKWSVGVPSV